MSIVRIHTTSKATYKLFYFNHNTEVNSKNNSKKYYQYSLTSDKIYLINYLDVIKRLYCIIFCGVFKINIINSLVQNPI